MKRRAPGAKLLLFLLALLVGGAIINIAVAWCTANLIGNPWIPVYSGIGPQPSPVPHTFMHWHQGWPMTSLTCVLSQDGYLIKVERRQIFGWVVARNPIWPGFAINTIFYAAVLWVLFAVPGAIRRRIGGARIMRGQCAACGYSLRGTSGGTCPECGAIA